MPPKYLMHVTLNTGHARRSYRDEVDDAVVSLLQDQLAEARAGLPVTIQPGYHMSLAAPDGPMLATMQTDDGTPIVTIAAVVKSLHSAKTWALLKPLGALGDAPAPPWCAVHLYPAATDAKRLTWLGDFERCLAWAWIET